MKTLTTVGQQLVAAVANSLIVPLSITFEVLFATSAYTVPPGSDIEVVAGVDPVIAGAGWLALAQAGVADVLTGAGSLTSSFPVIPANVSATGFPSLNAADPALVIGQPLWLVNYGTELATGDSPVKVTTLYNVVAA